MKRCLVRECKILNHILRATIKSVNVNQVIGEMLLLNVIKLTPAKNAPQIPTALMHTEERNASANLALKVIHSRDALKSTPAKTASLMLSALEVPTGADSDFFHQFNFRDADKKVSLLLCPIFRTA